MRHRIFPTCNPIIPTIFDDSMSYYEVVCKLRQSIIDLKKYIDESLDGLEDYINQEIKEAKDEIYKYLDEFETEINNQIKDFENFTKDSIEAINNKLIDVSEKLKIYIENVDKSNRNWTLDRIEEVKELVNEINEDGFRVFNPWRGIKTKMQTVIDDIYNMWINLFSLTAEEYDNLNYTALEYDSKKLTAIQYDTQSKLLLSDLFIPHMFSPISGKYTSIINVIYELITLHFNTVTCAAYDSLNLSSQAYDDKNISAYQFNFQNNILEVI